MWISRGGGPFQIEGTESAMSVSGHFPRTPSKVKWSESYKPEGEVREAIVGGSKKYAGHLSLISSLAFNQRWVGATESFKQKSDMIQLIITNGITLDAVLSISWRGKNRREMNS